MKVTPVEVVKASSNDLIFKTKFQIIHEMKNIKGTIISNSTNNLLLIVQQLLTIKI